jgi:hypothetical protein
MPTKSEVRDLVYAGGGRGPGDRPQVAVIQKVERRRWRSTDFRRLVGDTP